jgi:hypothetical protein
MKKTFSALLLVGLFIAFNYHIIYAESSSYSELNIQWDQLTISGGVLNTDYEIRWMSCLSDFKTAAFIPVHRTGHSAAFS